MPCTTNTTIPSRLWKAEAVSIGSILSRVWAKLLYWQGRASARNHVKMLDDQQLRDIGLTRAQLLSALS